MTGAAECRLDERVVGVYSTVAPSLFAEWSDVVGEREVTSIDERPGRRAREVHVCVRAEGQGGVRRQQHVHPGIRSHAVLLVNVCEQRGRRGGGARPATSVPVCPATIDIWGVNSGDIGTLVEAERARAIDVRPGAEAIKVRAPLDGGKVTAHREHAEQPEARQGERPYHRADGDVVERSDARGVPFLEDRLEDRSFDDPSQQQIELSGGSRDDWSPVTSRASRYDAKATMVGYDENVVVDPALRVALPVRKDVAQEGVREGP